MRILAVLSLVLACAAPAVAAMPNPDDAIAVSGVVQHRLKAADISVSMVSELPYAVAYWKAGTGYSAGQALLKKGKSGWTIVTITNVKFNSVTLIEAGVPSATTKALIADLKVVGQ
jgi:hypothetical protein